MVSPSNQNPQVTLTTNVMTKSLRSCLMSKKFIVVLNEGERNVKVKGGVEASSLDELLTKVRKEAANYSFSNTQAPIQFYDDEVKGWIEITDFELPSIIKIKFVPSSNSTPIQDTNNSVLSLTISSAVKNLAAVEGGNISSNIERDILLSLQATNLFSNDESFCPYSISIVGKYACQNRHSAEFIISKLKEAGDSKYDTFVVAFKNPGYWNTEVNGVDENGILKGAMQIAENFPIRLFCSKIVSEVNTRVLFTGYEFGGSIATLVSIQLTRIVGAKLARY